MGPAKSVTYTKKQLHCRGIAAVASFFGLTLSLKIINSPHNKQETVRMTVWRCNIAPEIYRRMCVMVAWRLDQRQVEQKLETV